jgi:hypothetical protein
LTVPLPQLVVGRRRHDVGGRLVGRLRLDLRDGPTALGELGGTVTIDREF